MRKRAVAQPASRRSKTAFLIISCTTWHLHGAGTCQRIRAADLPDKILSNVLEQTVDGLRKSTADVLHPLLHPKLKVSKPDLEATLIRQRDALKPVFEVSVHSLWKLTSPEERAERLDCDEGIAVYSHYGYATHYAAWLQILGQEELGRVFITLVPKDGFWRIGALQWQRWTHRGKDPEAWLAEAEKDMQRQEPLAAYLRVDIARKLFGNNPYFELARSLEVKQVQDKLMSLQEWLTRIASVLPRWRIVHVASTFAAGGPGLLIRVQTDAEPLPAVMKQNCADILSILKEQKWFAGIAGLQCSHVVVGEDPLHDGALGSVFKP